MLGEKRVLVRLSSPQIRERVCVKLPGYRRVFAVDVTVHSVAWAPYSFGIGPASRSSVNKQAVENDGLILFDADLDRHLYSC